MERSTGKKPLKNRCQQNSCPLLWVLGAPKSLLTSLATPTTKQREGLGEGGRRGERRLLPRLLSPPYGDSSAGGSSPALQPRPVRAGWRDSPSPEPGWRSRTAEPQAGRRPSPRQTSLGGGSAPWGPGCATQAGCPVPPRQASAACAAVMTKAKWPWGIRCLPSSPSPLLHHFQLRLDKTRKFSLPSRC